MLDVDEDGGQHFALLGLDGTVEVLGTVGVGQGLEEGREGQFLKREFLLGQKGNDSFLELGVVLDEVLHLTNSLGSDDLNSAFHLLLNLQKVVPNSSLLLSQLVTLLLNPLQLLLQRLIRQLALLVPLDSLLRVVNQPRVSKRPLVRLQIRLHAFKCPRVLLAHLEHYLLEGLVVADVLLEV